MNDITMCPGEGCTLRESCYRHTAPVGIRRQAVFTETPKERPCRYFWNNDGKKSGGEETKKWWTRS